MSGMAGKPVKVKVGDPPPVFHFKLLKKCFICEFGHHHWEYGSPNQQAEEFDAWLHERHEARSGGGWD